MFPSPSPSELLSEVLSEELEEDESEDCSEEVFEEEELAEPLDESPVSICVSEVDGLRGTVGSSTADGSEEVSLDSSETVSEISFVPSDWALISASGLDWAEGWLEADSFAQTGSAPNVSAAERRAAAMDLTFDFIEKRFLSFKQIQQVQ